VPLEFFLLQGLQKLVGMFLDINTYKVKKNLAGRESSQDLYIFIIRVFLASIAVEILF
jgi:hypothetical protein